MSEINEFKVKGLNKKAIIIAAVVIVVLAIAAIALISGNSSATAAKLKEQLDLGDRYLSELEYEQAVAAYTAAIEIDPKNMDAYLGLADAYIATGEFAKAEEVLKQAEAEVGEREEILAKWNELLAVTGGKYGSSADFNITGISGSMGNAEATGTKPTATSIPASTRSEEAVYKDFKYVVVSDSTIEVTKYMGEEETVIVPTEIEGKMVTSIGRRAFKDCESAVEVILPESLLEIGLEAFVSCVNLQSINIPDNVKKIRSCAFQGCDNLSGLIKIPKGVTIIENSVFGDCESISAVEIPEGIVKIEAGAFRFCKSLTELVLPDTLESIEASAFWGCTGLEYVKIPQNMKYEGAGIFDGTKWEKQLLGGREHYLLNNTVYVYRGDAAEVYVPEGMTDVDFHVSAVVKVTLPESVTRIADEAFLICKNLQDIKIPTGVKSIGNMAFQYCNELREIVIPEGVESIGSQAFDGCRNLVCVELPSSVKKIDIMAFGYGGGQHADFMLRVPQGSYAESFAKENGISYVVK